MSCGCKVLNDFTKTPWERRDYPIDYTRVLKPGETVSGSAWVIHADLTEETTGIGTTATVIDVSGGVFGKVYFLINRMTTSTGQRFERAIRLKICEVGS